MAIMTLCWITENGNEWLNEDFEFNPNDLESAKQICINYVKNTSPEARSLEKHWEGDGADVTLVPWVMTNDIATTLILDQVFDQL